MKENIKKSQKMENIQDEDFTVEQEYMNSKSVESSRTQLRIRLEMLETFKDNYRTKYRTLGRGEEDRDPGLLCGDCGESQDSQSHCLLCPAWQEARERLDLDCIGDLLPACSEGEEGEAGQGEEGEEEEREGEKGAGEGEAYVKGERWRGSANSGLHRTVSCREDEF